MIAICCSQYTFFGVNMIDEHMSFVLTVGLAAGSDSDAASIVCSQQLPLPARRHASV